MTIFSIGPWNGNAELIDDCFNLDYLAVDRFTLDVTYGLGRFWTIRRPKHLMACDINAERSPLGRSIDYTDLPWDDEMFQDVVMDPPYRLSGTPDSGGPAAMDDGYGVDEYVSWEDRHKNIKAGIRECARVLEPGGHYLLKCQDQVSGGKVRWQTREFAAEGEEMGLRLKDALLLQGHRKNPSNKRGQQHSQRNYSTMLVFVKPKRRSKR